MVQNKKLKENEKEKCSGFRAYDEQAQDNQKEKLNMNKKIHDDELLEIENDFYVFSELENDIDDREA